MPNSMTAPPSPARYATAIANIFKKKNRIKAVITRARIASDTVSYC